MVKKGRKKSMRTIREILRLPVDYFDAFGSKFLILETLKISTTVPIISKKFGFFRI